MKIALLIPTLPERKELLDRLITEILRQMNEQGLAGGVNEEDKPDLEVDVCILVNEDNREKTTGKKRNELIQLAVNSTAKAIAFVDDDDMIGPTYIKRAVEFVESGMDCGELWGQIYFNGKLGNPFHHYLGCTHAWQDDKQYHRPPNHLNFMKLDLIKGFKFEDKSFGEDMCFAMELQKNDVFKNMYPINEIIYSYFVGSPKYQL